MYHSIEQVANKIDVMYQKAQYLEKHRADLSPEEVKFQMDDIQALAGDIYNDRGQY